MYGSGGTAEKFSLSLGGRERMNGLQCVYGRRDTAELFTVSVDFGGTAELFTVCRA